MARKKSGGPKEVTAPPASKTRPVRLDLEPEDHRILRLIAAYDDVSMANYARDVLTTHLRAEAKARGIKF